MPTSETTRPPEAAVHEALRAAWDRSRELAAAYEKAEPDWLGHALLVQVRLGLANLRGFQFGVLNTMTVLASTDHHSDKVSASTHPEPVKDVVPCTPKGRLAVQEFEKWCCFTHEGCAGC